MAEFKNSDKFKRTSKDINPNRHKSEHIRRWEWIGRNGKTYSEITAPDSEYRKTLFGDPNYKGNDSRIDHHLTYDIEHRGMIKKIGGSQTNIKNTLFKFSQNWESYVEECKNDSSATHPYTNKKEHFVWDLFHKNLKNEFKSIVDEKKFLVETSLGDGNTAVIPWLCVMNRSLTETVREQYYICYLFSRNAKYLYLSIGLGATQFSDRYGETNKCVDRINEAKNIFKSNFNEHAPQKDHDKIDLFDEKDTKFIRKEISSSPKFKISAYETGSFFIKKYNLDDESLTEKIFKDDFESYMQAYEDIYLDPRSDFIQNLSELVVKEEDMSEENLDYEIPEFTPIPPKEKRNTSSSKNSSPRKINHQESRKTGIAGEEHVFKFEVNALKKGGRSDLANSVVKQCEDHTDYPGYDIKSYNLDGSEKFIEVKSTKLKSKNSFDISHNEWIKGSNSAKNMGESYWVYIVAEASKQPKIVARIRNPYKLVSENKMKSTPTNYKIEFGYGHSVTVE